MVIYDQTSHPWTICLIWPSCIGHEIYIFIYIYIDRYYMYYIGLMICLELIVWDLVHAYCWLVAISDLSHSVTVRILRFVALVAAHDITSSFLTLETRNRSNQTKPCQARMRTRWKLDGKEEKSWMACFRADTPEFGCPKYFVRRCPFRSWKVYPKHLKRFQDALSVLTCHPRHMFLSFLRRGRRDVFLGCTVQPSMIHLTSF